MSRPQVMAAGAASRTRYALIQSIHPRLPGELPVVQVGEDGSLVDAGKLCTLTPKGSWFSFDQLGWPDGRDCRDGLRDDLPYFTADMRPQGVLGQAFARSVATSLNLPDAPREWQSEDLLLALASFGYDMPGNLIIGDEAIRRFEEQSSQPLELLAAEESLLLPAYEQLAIKASLSTPARSTVAGVFPKFITARVSPQDGETPHVIVKYSGNDGSPPITRWADLLVCEHLALETITQELGVSAAKSRILRFEGRIFLEVERFDRVGHFGRRGVVSLQALNNAISGSSAKRWDELVIRLAPHIRLSRDAIRDAHLLFWFGRMIGNTDMHGGNIAFMMGKTVSLAPAYDMLPMKYAPAIVGEVRQTELLRSETFTLPYSQRALLAGVWNRAQHASMAFWQRASEDERITSGFRQICRENLVVLTQVPQLLDRSTNKGGNAHWR